MFRTRYLIVIRRLVRLAMISGPPFFNLNRVPVFCATAEVTIVRLALIELANAIVLILGDLASIGLIRSL